MHLYLAGRLQILSPLVFFHNHALSFLWLGFWVVLRCSGCFLVAPDWCFREACCRLLRLDGWSVEGPPFIRVLEWTLVNHLMRAEGTCPHSLCLLLQTHTHTHTHTLTRTHAHAQGWTFSDTCFRHNDNTQIYAVSGNICLAFKLLILWFFYLLMCA